MNTSIIPCTLLIEKNFYVDTDLMVSKAGAYSCSPFVYIKVNFTTDTAKTSRLFQILSKEGAEAVVLFQVMKVGLYNLN